MIKLNRKVFFAEVRKGPFNGRLTANQVSGMEDLLNVWEESGTDDPRHLAYCFATDFHETGAKMQPVREGFKSSDKSARAYVQRNYGHKGPKWYCWPQGPFGQVYYGRGDVQLTWYDNYVRMGKILGLPLAKNPDLVLKSSVSKMILVEGMLYGASKDGDFTGKALEDYFSATKNDPVNARRIVNGKDKAQKIAGYHKEFLGAVIKAEAEYDPGEVVVADPEGPARLPKANDQTSWGAGIAVLGGLTGTASSLLDKATPTTVGVIIAVIVVGGILIARGRNNLIKNTGE